MAKTRLQARKRRKVSIRKNVFGTADRPRPSVFRRARHIYPQPTVNPGTTGAAPVPHTRTHLPRSSTKRFTAGRAAACWQANITSRPRLMKPGPIFGRP